jgi:adenylosuccinate lyase
MSSKSISPLDDRYADQVRGLSDFLSEGALIRYRLHVEIEWLITMAEREKIIHVRPFSEKENHHKGVCTGGNQ